MEITREVYEAHRMLSLTNIRFLEHVSQYSEGRNKSSYAELFNFRELVDSSLQIWPTFINQETKKEISEASVKMFNLIKSLPERLLDNDPLKIGSYYEIPSEMFERNQYENENLIFFFGGGEFTISPITGLKCINFNNNCDIGLWKLDFLESCYMKIPIVSNFLMMNKVRLIQNKYFEILFDDIFQRINKRYGREGQNKVNILIVLNKSHHQGYREYEVLLNKSYANYLNRKDLDPTGKILFCNDHHLHVINQCLMCQDERVHVVIESNWGKMPSPIDQIVKRGNLILYKEKNASIYSSIFNLSLLSEYQESDCFSPEEKSIIRRYIPWTRKIVPGFTLYNLNKINLEDFIVSHREDLVIKSANDSGDNKVYIGVNTPIQKWKKILDKAILEKKWIVQEYVPSGLYLYQYGEKGYTIHQSVWKLFLLGSQYAGGVVQVLPEKVSHGVINSYNGAQKSIILEVME